MTHGRGFGNYILQLLRFLKVKRMALIVGDDKLSASGGEDVEIAMNKAGITIVTKILLSQSIVDEGDFTLFYHTLQTVDARYIVIIAPRTVVTDFYYNSRSYSLISPNHVWIGSNLAMPQDNILTDDIPDFDSPPIQNFATKWNALRAQNPAKFPSMATTIWYTGVYDCVKLMMLGIHQFTQSIPHYTPEMLANGSLNKFLTPDKFANTGKL
ncbi:hypothetical protein HDU76_002748 [Blyttiomyces sp. JEL0837]|nr:hypothetical protein HDU76_002748 [Blyttiomyces sp. JEL0837]